MFGKKKEIEVPVRTTVPTEPVVEAPKAEEPVKAAPTRPQTVIAEDVIMVGNFETKEPIVLRGKLRGNIHSTDSLSISKTGSLVGEAAVSALSSDGRIEGSILCSNTAEFGSMARMRGNLSTAALKTADGSAFEGKLTMITKQVEEAAEKFADAFGEAEEIVNAAADEAEAFAGTIKEDAEEFVEDAQDISKELFGTAEDAAEGVKDTVFEAAEEIKETTNKFSWN